MARISARTSAGTWSSTAMIETAKREFGEHGVREDRLFYDSFEFGLDVPVKVLAKPH